MKVTFCGHGDTVISNELREWLHQTILAQIEAGADLFYLGGYGSFDRAAAAAVWNTNGAALPGRYNMRWQRRKPSSIMLRGSHHVGLSQNEKYCCKYRFSTCGSLFMYDWIISPL